MFSRDMSRIELDCKNYKSLSWGNKKDENNKYDQNCNKLERGQNESAQELSLRNTEIDKMMKVTNLTNLNYKNLDGGQNERACANRCDKQ